MKRKTCAAVCVAAAMGLMVMTGCSGSPSFQQANEMTFSLEGISEVTISYDEENITFYEGKDGELTVKEYMTEYESSYCARVEQTGGSIKISEGGKPFFKGGFSRRIEVWLPASYHETLTVTTTDGTIDLSDLTLSLDALRIDSTAGTVRLGAVEAGSVYLSTTSGTLDVGCLDADVIRVETTSGSFLCERLDGNVTYTTTNGNAEIKSAIGSGSYQASNSGELNVVYSEVTGDLSFYNKNDGVCVVLPAGLEFEFEAATKNGTISTSFQDLIFMQDGTARGTVGARPAVTVKVETKNGNIEVRQQRG